MKVQHYHLSSLKKNIEHVLFDLKILMFSIRFLQNWFLRTCQIIKSKDVNPNISFCILLKILNRKVKFVVSTLLAQTMFIKNGRDNIGLSC